MGQEIGDKRPGPERLKMRCAPMPQILGGVDAEEPDVRFWPGVDDRLLTDLSPSFTTRSIQLDYRHDDHQYVKDCPNIDREWHLVASVIDGRVLFPQVGVCAGCGCEPVPITDLSLALQKLHDEAAHRAATTPGQVKP